MKPQEKGLPKSKAQYKQKITSGDLSHITLDEDRGRGKSEIKMIKNSSEIIQQQQAKKQNCLQTLARCLRAFTNIMGCTKDEQAKQKYKEPNHSTSFKNPMTKSTKYDTIKPISSSMSIYQSSKQQSQVEKRSKNKQKNVEQKSDYSEFQNECCNPNKIPKSELTQVRGGFSQIQEKEKQNCQIVESDSTLNFAFALNIEHGRSDSKQKEQNISKELDNNISTNKKNSQGFIHRKNPIRKNDQDQDQKNKQKKLKKQKIVHSLICGCKYLSCLGSRCSCHSKGRKCSNLCNCTDCKNYDYQKSYDFRLSSNDENQQQQAVNEEFVKNEKKMVAFTVDCFGQGDQVSTKSNSGNNRSFNSESNSKIQKRNQQSLMTEQLDVKRNNKVSYALLNAAVIKSLAKTNKNKMEQLISLVTLQVQVLILMIPPIKQLQIIEQIQTKMEFFLRVDKNLQFMQDVVRKDINSNSFFIRILKFIYFVIIFYLPFLFSFKTQSTAIASDCFLQLLHQSN